MPDPSNANSLGKEPDQQLAELLLRVQQHQDDRAMNEIIEKTLDDIFHLAYRCVGNQDGAADLAQEVFSVFARCYRTIDNPNRLRSWLYGVTIKLARKHRRDPREVLLPLDLLTVLYEGEGSVHSPLEAMCDNEAGLELANALAHAIQTLEPRLRECIELLYYRRCTAGEAARVMGVSVQTIYSYHANARAALSSHEDLKRWL